MVWYLFVSSCIFGCKSNDSIELEAVRCICCKYYRVGICNGFKYMHRSMKYYFHIKNTAKSINSSMPINNQITIASRFWTYPVPDTHKKKPYKTIWTINKLCENCTIDLFIISLMSIALLPLSLSVLILCSSSFRHCPIHSVQHLSIWSDSNALNLWLVSPASCYASDNYSMKQTCVGNNCEGRRGLEHRKSKEKHFARQTWKPLLGITN